MPLCQSLTVSIKIAVIFIATSYSFQQHCHHNSIKSYQPLALGRTTVQLKCFLWLSVQ